MASTAERITPQLLQWLHGVLSPEYTDPRRTYGDIVEALRTVPSLSPRTDVYTHETGRSELLFVLYGTLPASFRGNTYNIPVLLWIPHQYPKQPPIAFVSPAADMLIRPGNHVDGNGRCYHPYLTGWERYSDRSNIVDLCDVLRGVFGREPPVYAKAAQQQQQQQQQQQMQQPQAAPPVPPLPAELARREVPVANTPQQPPAPPPIPPLPKELAPPVQQTPQAPAAVVPPPPPPKPVVSQDPQQQQRYGVGSPVPGARPPPPQWQPPQQQQQRYQPPAPPYGHPAAGGALYTPPPPHHQSPLPPQQQQQHGYTYGPPRPIQSPPPPQQQTPPRPQSYSGPPPPPLPPQIHQQAHPHNTNAPVYSPHPPNRNSYQQIQPQQLQQQPPTSPPPPQPKPKPQPILDLMNDSSPSILLPSQSSQSTSANANANPNTATSPPPPAPPPNPQKDHLIHTIANHLHSLATTTYHKTSDALSTTAEQRSALLALEERLGKEKAELLYIQGICAADAAILKERIQGAEGLVREVASEGGRYKIPDIDKVVCAPTVVHSQLYELVTEDMAIEDAIYVLGKALDRERVGLDVFLKHTRTLAREQFLLRATVKKIVRQIGLDG